MRARLGVAARGSVRPVAAPPSGRATVRDRVQDSAGRIGSATRKSLPQPAGYMDVCAAIAGYLAIFNRSTKPWREECSGGARCSSASLVSRDREENGRDREPRRTAVADLPAEDAPRGELPAQAHECPT